MCLGAILVLEEAWEDGGARAGRLSDGSVVTLAFVPGAQAGSELLVHLGIPVEVLEPGAAAAARSLRAGAHSHDSGGTS